MANRFNARTVWITRATGLVSVWVEIYPWPGQWGAELSLLRCLARLALERDDFCGLPGASPQRFFEARGLTVLSQEIAERFVSELLEGLHAF